MYFLMKPQAGVEPATSRLGSVRSLQMSYCGICTGDIPQCDIYKEGMAA